MMLDKVAIQPGEALRGKTPKGVPKPGVGIPAESTQKVEKELSDVSTKMDDQEEARQKAPTAPEIKKEPGKPTPVKEKPPEQKSKETAKQQKDTEQLGKTTKQVSESVDKLDKAFKNLLK